MSSPRRKSLAALFPQLQITSQSSATMSSPFTQTLKATLKKSFPTCGSVKGPLLRANFTLKMDRNYDYSTGSDEDDPDEHFDLTQSFFEDVQDIFQNYKLSEDQDSNLEKFLLQSLTSVIFGSNYVEDAGLGHDVTYRICKELFSENVDASKIEVRSDEYQAALETIVQRGEKGTNDIVLRSRLEIVNHALALKHILTEIVIRNKPLTEDLILTTHSILMNGISTDDGQSSSEYAGIYRNVDVHAAYSSFTPHQSVPLLMKTLVLDYNKDLLKAEDANELDPFYIAAQYGHRFVNIHPFRDGNGRTCRLILNAIVLKYAGILVDIGEKEGEREEYMVIAQNGGLKQVEFDEQDGEGKVPWGELASFIIKKSYRCMEKLRNNLKVA